MTTTEQQRQTLVYFKAYAKDWLRKSDGGMADQVNIIRQRNDFVLDWLKAHPKAVDFLDAGCGTGQLVLDAARKGVRAVGVDFAEEMIRVAQQKARGEKRGSARFVCSSLFEFPIQDSSYDVISANGFIEYISYAQLLQFLKTARRGLKRNGTLILGSRNRLFNLFSLNQFTEEEAADGAFRPLLAEAMALTQAKDLSALKALKPAKIPPPPKKQANTGINVSVRLQYTPLQLIRLLEKHGFSRFTIRPIHIHAVPLGFKKSYPAIHTQISNLLQPFADEHPEPLPFSSSFMISARTRG